MSPWWRRSGNTATIATDCGASALGKARRFPLEQDDLSERHGRSGLNGASIDAVVIGRNEGDRLIACLDSLQGQVRSIVYVDSGSSDGSLEVARRVGATIVELDPEST